MNHNDVTVRIGEFIRYEIGPKGSYDIRRTLGYGFVLPHGFTPTRFCVSCVSGGYDFKPNDWVQESHSIVNLKDGDVVEEADVLMFE